MKCLALAEGCQRLAYVLGGFGIELPSQADSLALMLKLMIPASGKFIDAFGGFSVLATRWDLGLPD